jgi:hypothetical protein
LVERRRAARSNTAYGAKMTPRTRSVIATSWLLAASLAACSDSDAVLADAAPDAVVATACSGSRFPAIGDPLSCCELGDETWHVIGSPGADYGKLAYRTYGNPCKLEDGVTAGCGIGTQPMVQCFYGPCGARNQWAAGGGDAGAHIFVPRTDPALCGWDVAGGDHDPEPYTDQPLYAGVVAACPFNRCLPEGRPAVSAFALAVTGVTAAASGTVTSSPAGISLAGAGTASWGYEGGMTVTLTATPKGPYARAVLGGDCSATGAHGAPASCVVALDANKAVTVTYECQTDQTCEL